MVRSIRSSTGMSFSPVDIPAPMPSVAGAAENASVAETFSNLQNAKVDYGSMGKNAIAAAGYEERAVRDANTFALNSRIKNEAEVEATGRAADAEKDAAAAASSGSTFGSIAKAGIGLVGSVLLSDETTKNTIENIDDALSKLKQLRPVTFYYNEEYTTEFQRRHNGFIAQEYKNVLPEATYFDESTEKLCIDTGELIALLVRSVQQLEGRVAHMEATKALAGVN